MEAIYNYISKNMTTVKKEDLIFPYLDYGFLYGYGLFESIRVLDGKAILLQDHINRIRKCSIELEIPFFYSDEDIKRKVDELISINNVVTGVLNFYLTPGDRGIDPAKVVDNDPFFLILMRQYPKYSSEDKLSLDVRPLAFQRTPLDRYKTLSWMKNVLENKLSTFDDILLYDDNEMLLETTRSNMFFIKDDVLITPKSTVILPGITRGFLIKSAAKLSFKIEEREVYVGELLGFDEVFLTNSLRSIILVDSINNIPNLKSKEKTIQIQKSYFELANNS
jgi:branched-subunit amino acid aminotransferase/4-amino-4-deoxychorismate lyase